MTNEDKILSMLKSGKKYREIIAELGVKQSEIWKVAQANRDQVPKRGRKTLWSFKAPDEYTMKMLHEIAERRITPTELLNEIVGGWCEKNNK